MAKSLRFLVPDGYPKESRDQFDEVGMTLAGILYEKLLLKYLPEAQCDIWYTTDAPDQAPDDETLAGYAGILWPGCNLTVYHDDERCKCHLSLARRAFELGVPGIGSCWGIQLPVYVAGGKVEPHPQGREMGVIRNIRVTEEGQKHPMFSGKPVVFSHFLTHDDYVTALPEGSAPLAANTWCPVQATAVKYKNGEFWGVQYHPEYDLHEMARLIIAREPKLVKQGYFRGHEDLMAYVARLEELHAEPGRKDLRWQLGVDDTILDDGIRQREFINWLNYLVLPKAGVTKGV